jgi:hypothetical protein
MLSYHQREADVNFKIEFDREDDGRWIAEIAELPGVLAYGATREEAEAAVEALALENRKNIGDKIRCGVAQLDRGEGIPEDQLDARLKSLKH